MYIYLYICTYIYIYDIDIAIFPIENHQVPAGSGSQVPRRFRHDVHGAAGAPSEEPMAGLEADGSSWDVSDVLGNKS